MNRFISVIFGFIIVNLIFSAIPYLAPRTSPSALLPYQLWANCLVLFVLILPEDSGFTILYNT